MEKPKKRSEIRNKLGFLFYGTLRRLLWIKKRSSFASEKVSEPFPFEIFRHSTPLRRQLKDLDMWTQENKITNLTVAVKQLNGIVLQPGETFSYWYLIGKPSRKKGYLPGLVLKNGTLQTGIGGGLCQLSNLICYMTMHTPLTITERHRHGYDVFPDSNRTQPFASGATCAWPHIDLMIRNDTDESFQLILEVGKDELKGQWRSTEKARNFYRIIEKNHQMKSEFWGGYSRHNEIHKQTFDLEGKLLSEELLFKNSAVMMYSPFISEKTEAHNSD